MSEEEYSNRPVVDISIRAHNHRLRDERRKMGLNLSQAGEAIGISEGTLSKYETLGQIPPQKIAKKISDFYCQPIEYFFPDIIKYATLKELGKTKVFPLTQPQLEYQPKLLEYVVQSPEEEQIDEEELESDIQGAIDSLTPREAQVIETYFGLGGKERLTLKQIGVEFGLSRERVRQIKEKAIRRLRHTSRSRGLKKYLHMF